MSADAEMWAGRAHDELAVPGLEMGAVPPHRGGMLSFRRRHGRNCNLRLKGLRFWPESCRRLGLPFAQSGGMAPRENDLVRRTLDYALAVKRFGQPLLRTLEVRNAASQLLRSSSSVAANYRAACVARSRKEFIAKLGLAIEEADETVFWLEYLEAAAPPALKDEGEQLSRILKASRETARRNERDNQRHQDRTHRTFKA